MKRQALRLIAAILVLAMVLTGCQGATESDGPSLRENLAANRAGRETETTAPSEEVPAPTPDEPRGLTFPEFQYTRPDMEALNSLLQAACDAAALDDPEAVMAAVNAYYEAYDRFYTDYFLADIHYSADLTDVYWETEYNFCADQTAQVDAGYEELHYALADSPCREELEQEECFGEGFFDGYDGENGWDETFTAMLAEEAALQSRYYELSGAAIGVGEGSQEFYDTYGLEMAQVLVDLIALRQEMAAYWDYDSYADFAWDFYYYRDYTPEQMETYMEAISRELVPIYEEIAYSRVWGRGQFYAEEDETAAYVRSAAANMGGIITEAYELMESRQLYDIMYSENKYASSFEVFLMSYDVPYVFLCPNLSVSDRLTFAHEFGHFCNDYATGGTGHGIDVLEVFSQAMEYLSLCYTEEDEALVRYKLADSLGTYVVQSAFGTFEHRAYKLTGSELSVEGLCRVYEQVAKEFGFETVGYHRMEFVTIPHFFTSPLYIDSYVVSNDASMQIYQLELESPGAGLQRYVDTVGTDESYFLAFVEEASLVSPFAPGQLESIRDLFRGKLLAQ